MLHFNIISVILAVCVLLCASQPVEKLSMLKELPEEILFKENSEFILECSTVENVPGIRYSWLKDRAPLTLNSDISERDNGGTLLFAKPSIHDAADYQCLAHTDIGVASSRIVHVRRLYLDAPNVSLQKHAPVEGKHFKLDCDIPNAYPKPEIVWLYQLISDPSVSRNILDRRIIQAPDGTLFFTNVTKEDTSQEHKYVCVARSDAVEGDVVLAEHVIADVVSSDGDNSELVPLYLSSDMIAKVGDVTMIYCIYGGTPLAFPDWYKDSKNINNNPKDRVTRYNRTGGKRLLIKDTWASDEGAYLCIVGNGVAEPQHHIMYLTVISPPKISKPAEQKLIVKAGDDVTLQCHVTGSPAPVLSWTRNAQPLSQRADTVSLANTTISTVTLSHVTAADNGYYGCSARNEYGDAYMETLVYVQ